MMDNHLTSTIWGLLIPFIGTTAGAACVFLMKKDLRQGLQRVLTGFAAGAALG